jgi:site-specific DNA-methyltransferase (adenine-specific)
MIGSFKCCSIVQGDCLELMKALPDGCVDAVITDPPYSETTHSGARTRNAAENTTDNVLVPFTSIDSRDLRRVLCEIGRTTRRWVVSFMDWRHLAQLENSLPITLRFVRFGMWVKPNGAPQFTGDRPATGWEAIGIFHANNAKLRWNGGGQRGVWDCPAVHGDHPTQKPVELVTELTQLFSDDQDLILDPFAGSGTTLVAAKKLGRHFLGFEISPEYCEIARDRLARIDAQPSLFEPKPEQLSLNGGDDRG